MHTLITMLSVRTITTSARLTCIQKVAFRAPYSLVRLILIYFVRAATSENIFFIYNFVGLFLQASIYIFLYFSDKNSYDFLLRCIKLGAIKVGKYI